MESTSEGLTWSPARLHSQLGVCVCVDCCSQADIHNLKNALMNAICNGIQELVFACQPVRMTSSSPLTAWVFTPVVTARRAVT